jgi:hypothetical protein
MSAYLHYCSVQLWGVGNPVVERHTSRLEQKADAGAEAFLSQPPLDWGNFERWMHDARARSLHERCRVLIGVPMLTSAAHLKFWISLCDAQVQGAVCCSAISETAFFVLSESLSLRGRAVTLPLVGQFELETHLSFTSSTKRFRGSKWGNDTA